jgi:malate/lactate dehydrogenase
MLAWIPEACSASWSAIIATLALFRGAFVISGVPVDSFCASNGIELPDKSAIRATVNDVSYEIYKRKSNTNHGITASVCRIIRAIIVDERSILPVGTRWCREGAHLQLLHM